MAKNKTAAELAAEEEAKIAAEIKAEEDAEKAKIEADEKAKLAAETKAKEDAEKAKIAAEIKSEEDAEKAKAKAAKSASELLKAEKDALSKKKFKVCVTGFLAFGKMFRANDKISGKVYIDHVSTWLKEGKIKEVKK